MRRKEYAVSLGLATAGKGRMSREALAAIDKARAEGRTFDDDTPDAPKAPKPVKAPSRPVVRNFTEPTRSYRTGAVETSESVMGDVFTRYEMTQLFKGTDSNGKEHKGINVAQACYTCGYSLLGHTCNEPKVLIGSPLEWIAVTPQ